MTVDLRLPSNWKWNKGWRLPRSSVMLAVAVSWRSLMFGVEVIAGDAKGGAIVLGPLWIGFARLADEPRRVA